MIYIMKHRWDMYHKQLREKLSEIPDIQVIGYKDLVTIIFETIYNVPEESNFYQRNLNLKNMTVIDDGNYQGTFLFVIPFDTYQPAPNEYLMTFIYYGSCSGCDVLQGIQSETIDWTNPKPTKQQVDDLMLLSKEIVGNTIRPFNYGWRNDKEFNIVEMNEGGNE